MSNLEETPEESTDTNEYNWRTQISVGLYDLDLNIAERLCEIHNINRSALIRYLLLKEHDFQEALATRWGINDDDKENYE